jgi:hypothetical protein
MCFIIVQGKGMQTTYWLRVQTVCQTVPNFDDLNLDELQ